VPTPDQLVPGANLNAANLTGMDLRDLDLSGASLIGANLSGARMKGTRLDGARLFMARTEGTLDLDWGGALAHPFFAGGGRERLGTFKFYEPPAKPFARETVLPQDAILVGSQGDLFLMRKGESRYLFITPTGYCAQVMFGSGPVHAMTKVADRRIAFIHESKITLERDFKFWTEDTVSTAECDNHFSAAITHLGGTASGKLWVSFPGGIDCLDCKDLGRGHASTTQAFSLPDGFEPSSLAANRDGDLVFLAHPGLDSINVFAQLPEPTVLVLPLPKGAHAQRLALGTGETLWFTDPERNTLGCVWFNPDLPEPKVDLWPLAAKDSPPRGLHSLLLGPDGNMWYTQATPPGLGRIDEGGVHTFWPRPVPERVAEGKRPVAWAPLPGAASAAEEPGDEKKSVRRMDPAAPPRVPTPPSAEVSEAFAKAFLRSKGLELTEGALQHILDKHLAGPLNGASQFSATIRTREALLAMLIQGVDRARSVAGVTRWWDAAGICHTCCLMDDPVGHFAVPDPAAPDGVRMMPTYCFDIVTDQRTFLDGTRGHTILSAYPESPTRF
jgi:hypothetical protein